MHIEECFDDEGRSLWRKRFYFERLNRPGEWFTDEFFNYKVISSSVKDNIITTIVQQFMR